MTSRIFDKELGFVILCPERNIGGLKNTVTSIHNTFGDTPIVCVVGNDAHASELAEMNEVCPTIMGSDTITSLINVGLEATKAGWNMVLFAGSFVRAGIYRKFDLFATDEKDILFPVVDNKTDFVEGSMNGIILHKKTFDLVGNFTTSPMQKSGYNELEMIKLFWSLGAIENGCKFKAIVGMKVF